MYAKSLPPEVDQLLTELLGRWAERQRLTPVQAAAIRQVVIQETGELGDEWWEMFQEYMDSVRTRSGAIAAKLAGNWSSMGYGGMYSLIAASQAQSYEVPEYQLYLRLA